MITSFFSAEGKERRKICNNSRSIVKHLAVTLGERTLRKYENLQGARRFITEYFNEYGHRPTEDRYVVENREVANIVVDIPGYEEPSTVVVVGAHYDTIEGTPGADDNATAVAGLLELYRLLSPRRFRKTLRFVAFTLEEPPFFGSELMGSMHYAQACKRRKDNIELMVCLEMLGFGGRRAHQDYPFNDVMRPAPMHGDFLSVVSYPSSSKQAYLWKRLFNEHSRHKMIELIGPASIPGVGLSDHSSFVKQGYNAIMLCDTGFYRNKNYHTENDTYETINFRFLTGNIMGSYLTLTEILDRTDLFD